MKTVCAILPAFIALAGSAQAADKWDIKRIDTTKLPSASTQADITYDKDIKPLFQASCVRCHNERRARGDLHLDSLSGILAGGKDGKVVIPGDGAKSLLLVAASQIDNQIAMPPKFQPRRGGPGGGANGGPGGPPPGGPGGDQGGPPPGGGSDGPPPGGPNGGPPPSGNPNGPGPGGRGGRGGPPPKPLTAAQVSLLRAWIDQGAK